MEDAQDTLVALQDHIQTQRIFPQHDPWPYYHPAELCIDIVLIDPAFRCRTAQYPSGATYCCHCGYDPINRDPYNI